jgi:hypothetical protein
MQLKFNSQFAASVECLGGDFPTYLKLRLSGLEGQPYLYTEIDRHRADLCSGQRSLASASSLLQMPSLFAALIKHEPARSDALHALWYLYLTHQDLREAWAFTDPKLTEDLLNFAYWDAKSGSSYERATLLPYRETYLQLGDAINNGRSPE